MELNFTIPAPWTHVEVLLTHSQFIFVLVFALLIFLIQVVPYLLRCLADDLTNSPVRMKWIYSEVFLKVVTRLFSIVRKDNEGA